MNVFQAIILAVVEGITEFLPISSTGHLILTNRILGIAETEFTKSFEIIIQLGAILAVVFLYAKSIKTDFGTWKKVLAAFIPTGIVGLILYKLIKSFLLGNTQIVIWSLLIGGVIIIILEKYFERRKANLENAGDLSFVQAIVIGLLQAISVVPGVSRAAATIFAGLGMGLSRKSAVEFSFMLAIPTMAAAAGFDLVKTRLIFGSQEYFLIVVGLVGSFVTALITVKMFLKYVEKHSFIGFGVYRIVLAALFLLFVR